MIDREEEHFFRCKVQPVRKSNRESASGKIA